VGQAAQEPVRALEADRAAVVWDPVVLAPAQEVRAQEQVRALEADRAAAVSEAADPVVLAQALEVAKGLAEGPASVAPLEARLGEKEPRVSGCPRPLCFEVPPWAAPDYPEREASSWSPKKKCGRC
jgi:hypothetical protein